MSKLYERLTVVPMQSLPVTARDIEKATRWDATIGKVYRYVRDGWPSQVTDEFKPYQNRLTELTIEGGCLMWEIRVVILKGLQPQVLKFLHANHPGISRMKAITRRHLWWEGLDKEIKTLGKSCQSCQSNQSNPSVAPLHPWVWPGAPWERIHVDFAGRPFLGYMFFAAIDAHSGQKSIWWLLRHLKRPLKPYDLCLLATGYQNSWYRTMAPNSLRFHSSCMKEITLSIIYWAPLTIDLFKH